MVLVDERSLLRDCICSLLRRRAPDIEVYGFSSLEEVKLQHMSLVVLLIDRLGSEELSLIKRFVQTLRQQYSDTRVVAFLGCDDPSILKCAAELGITLVKFDTANSEIAVASIRLALAGSSFASTELLLGASEDWPASPARHIASVSSDRPDEDEHSGNGADGVPSQGITPREMELLEYLNRGLQNKVIAHVLGISESTVKVHLRNIMRKLNATNRTQVAVLMRHRADTLSEQGTPRPGRPVA